MKPGARIALLCTALGGAALAGLLGYRLGRSGATAQEVGDAKEQAAAPVAKVRTAPAERKDMAQLVTAYGTVIAAPEGVQTMAVPYECRVRRILVAAGQVVAPSTPLLEIEPSTEASLQLEEARSVRDAAARDLEQAEQRRALKVATNQEVNAAKQALDLAELRLRGFSRRGLATKQLLAKAPGVVSKLDVQEGQIVSAGATLVELVAENRIELRLGVEPSEVGSVQSEQVVRIEPVQQAAVEAGKPAPLEGQVRLVTHVVNPASRMVDVFVALPAHAELLIDSYVRGQIVVASKSALAVPRAAVLPEGEKYTLFTVRDGHAVKHLVDVGLADQALVEILGQAPAAGEPVVVEGNYELVDGMAVSTEQGK